MKKVIKASDSGLNAPVDYTTHLDSEDEVRKAYERYVRMYAKSGNERFLYKAEALQEILHISIADDGRVYEYYAEKYSQGNK